MVFRKLQPYLMFVKYTTLKTGLRKVDMQAFFLIRRLRKLAQEFPLNKLVRYCNQIRRSLTEPSCVNARRPDEVRRLCVGSWKLRSICGIMATSDLAGAAAADAPSDLRNTQHLFRAVLELNAIYFIVYRATD